MKTNMLQTLIDLQKRNINVYLTKDGIELFLKLMKEEVPAINNLTKAV